MVQVALHLLYQGVALGVYGVLGVVELAALAGAAGLYGFDLLLRRQLLVQRGGLARVPAGLLQLAIQLM